VKYLNSLAKHWANPNDLFLPGTYLQRTMQECPIEAVNNTFFEYFCAQGELDALAKLRAYALARGGT
jgi:hypothetical protein